MLSKVYFEKLKESAKTIMKIKSLSIILISIVFLFVFVAVPVAHSQNPKNPTDKALENFSTFGRTVGFTVNPDPDAGIYEKIALVINILLGLAGIAATILIIVAGTRWILAGGNEEQITKSKDTIKGSVIGIIIVLSAFVIVNFLVDRLVTIFTK